MAADHLDKRTNPPVEISWTPIDDNVLVIATCEACLIHQERTMRNDPDVGGLALLVGAEALAEAGCTHINAVTGTTRKTPT